MRTTHITRWQAASLAGRCGADARQMTADTLHRAGTAHRLLPADHLGHVVTAVVALIVLMVVTGLGVDDVHLPPISTSAPGQVRLPSPRPLPAVQMPPDHAPSR